MTTLSTAIKEARKHVTPLTLRSNRYYFLTDKVESPTLPYQMALKARSIALRVTALRIIGLSDSDAQEAVYSDLTASLPDIVARLIVSGDIVESIGCMKQRDLRALHNWIKSHLKNPTLQHIDQTEHEAIQTWCNESQTYEIPSRLTISGNPETYTITRDMFNWTLGV